MAKSAPRADQHFPPAELLFRRVHRANVKSDKRVTLDAFALPDMSVNRESHGAKAGTVGSSAEALSGFDPADWGVVAFAVLDIPPREPIWQDGTLGHELLPRHVPVPGNFAHSEVRVFRLVGENRVWLTPRSGDGLGDDPDSAATRDPAPLDPGFHQRWRKRLALTARLVVEPVAPTVDDQS